MNIQDQVPWQISKGKPDDAKYEFSNGKDLVMRGVTKQHASDRNRQQQKQQQVIGWTGYVSNAINHDSSQEQSEQAKRHHPGGDIARREKPRQPRRRRIRHKEKMTNQHDEQRVMKQPAENPSPFAGSKQTLEDQDFPRHPGGHFESIRRDGRNRNEVFYWSPSVADDFP